MGLVKTRRLAALRKQTTYAKAGMRGIIPPPKPVKNALSKERSKR